MTGPGFTASAVRVLFFAGLRLDPEEMAAARSTVEGLLEAARLEPPDLIVNGGDLATPSGYGNVLVCELLADLHRELTARAPTVVLAGELDLDPRKSVRRPRWRIPAGPPRLIEVIQPRRLQSEHFPIDLVCLPWIPLEDLLARSARLRDRTSEPLRASLALRKFADGLAKDLDRRKPAVLVCHAPAGFGGFGFNSAGLTATLDPRAIAPQFEVVLLAGETQALHGTPCPRDGRPIICAGRASATGADELPAWMVLRGPDGTWSARPPRPLPGREVTIDLRDIDEAALRAEHGSVWASPGEFTVETFGRRASRESLVDARLTILLRPAEDGTTAAGGRADLCMALEHEAAWHGVRTLTISTGPASEDPRSSPIPGTAAASLPAAARAEGAARP